MHSSYGWVTSYSLRHLEANWAEPECGRRWVNIWRYWMISAQKSIKSIKLRLSGWRIGSCDWYSNFLGAPTPGLLWLDYNLSFAPFGGQTNQTTHSGTCKFLGASYSTPHKKYEIHEVAVRTVRNHGLWFDFKLLTASLTRGFCKVRIACRFRHLEASLASQCPGQQRHKLLLLVNSLAKSTKCLKLMLRVRTVRGRKLWLASKSQLHCLHRGFSWLDC